MDKGWGLCDSISLSRRSELLEDGELEQLELLESTDTISVRSLEVSLASALPLKRALNTFFPVHLAESQALEEEML